MIKPNNRHESRKPNINIVLALVNKYVCYTTLSGHDYLPANYATVQHQSNMLYNDKSKKY